MFTKLLQVLIVMAIFRSDLFITSLLFWPARTYAMNIDYGLGTHNVLVPKTPVTYWHYVFHRLALCFLTNIGMQLFSGFYFFKCYSVLNVNMTLLLK